MSSLIVFLGELIDALAPSVPTIITDLENLVAQKKAQYAALLPQIQQADAATLGKLQGK